MRQKKIIVGLSGGVDSAVTAYLLKKSGYDVHAVFMDNWDDQQNQFCQASQDLNDAQNIADHLNIPLEIQNFSSQYKDEVFNDFIKEYSLGLTPNPDVFCNSHIKFKYLLHFALQNGAIGLATGHYAHKISINTIDYLSIPEDQNKDQTYFLSRLSQDQLKYAHFPLAQYTKNQIRKIAQSINLKVATKKDSTGICFIGKQDFTSFLSQYLLPNPGDIVDEQGKKLGSHKGLHFYTIGQRKGIQIGGLSRYHNSMPWYVARKDIKNNVLYVVQGDDHPALYNHNLNAAIPHLISEKRFPYNQKITARIRHRGPLCECTVTEHNKNSIMVRFSEPQRAITPAQFVVFYRDTICIGSAKILLNESS